MSEINFDSEVYQIEDDIINHFVSSQMFSDRDPFFVKIFALFITRKYITQKTLKKVTGLSAGKVSEEVNHLLNMGLIEKGEITKKGKITYVASSVGLMYLRFSRHSLTNLIDWEKEFLEMKTELNTKKSALERLEGYKRIKELNAFFLEIISNYKKTLENLDKAIQSLK